MRIVGLEVENVKRIEAVELKLDPEKGVIVIGGKNAAGKTSLIDAIEMGLRGRDSIPDEPVRRGKKKGKIAIDLGELKAERILTAKGSKLIITGNEDSGLTPQALLNKLASKLNFDPLRFATQKASEQVETLRDLVGLDFSEIDQQRDKLYDDRTKINGDAKNLKGQLEGYTKDDSAPDKEVSVAALTDELEKREETNRLNESERNMLVAISTNIGACKRDEEKVKKEILELRKKAEEIQKQIEENEKDLDSSKAEMEEYQRKYNEREAKTKPLVDANTAETKDQIRNAEGINAKIRENKKIGQTEFQLATAEIESEDLTDKIKDLDETKQKRLSEAEFPIDGLSFDESGVFYNQTPFAQCSSAERLRVSTAIGMAMNKDPHGLKIILIRDGSLLDADNLQMISEMADENGYQVWIERVGEGKECSIIIEDGRVRGE